MASKYWLERMARAQATLTEKNRKQIDKRMVKYYETSMKHVIDDFEATYNKLLITVGEGKEPTPADLYKLDKYWQLQGQMKEELLKLGNKQIAALSTIFETNFFEVYYSLNIEGMTAFSTIDKSMVEQMINQIWCADGKSWSQRIWGNINKLQDALNEGLIATVVTGKKTSDLKKVLQEQFGASYTRADAIVRTELAHIQTQAAKKRYEDYGLQEVEILADEDERRCPVCGKLHEKRYPIGAEVPIPAHPRCRCCIVPVVE